MTWVDSDDEHVIFNTEIHRAKFKNLERDPKVTVLIIDATNLWSYSEVRGDVAEVVRGQEARDHYDPSVSGGLTHL